MKNKTAFIWEVVGILVISTCGALLHFVFEWTGEWTPAALIAGVNESTWEHFKIAFWPMLIWGIIEYPFLKGKVNNFLIAKTKALYVTPVMVAIMFYSYVWITGGHSLLYDIITFVIAVVIGQMVSYYFMAHVKDLSKWKPVAMIFLVIIIIAFCLLSYYPIKSELWKDPVTDGYGIVKSSHE